MEDCNSEKYLAHSMPGKPIAEGHDLIDHLNDTASLAQIMASEFGAAGWGRLAGLWHDIGKYSADFQQYIRNTEIDLGRSDKYPRHVDHSTAGAILAVEQLGESGRLIAYQIAGHHAGLPDFESDTTGRAAHGSPLPESEGKHRTVI